MDVASDRAVAWRPLGEGRWLRRWSPRVGCYDRRVQVPTERSISMATQTQAAVDPAELEAFNRSFEARP